MPEIPINSDRDPPRNNTGHQPFSNKYLGFDEDQIPIYWGYQQYLDQDDETYSRPLTKGVYLQVFKVCRFLYTFDENHKPDTTARTSGSSGGTPINWVMTGMVGHVVIGVFPPVIEWTVSWQASGGSSNVGGYLYGSDPGGGPPTFIPAAVTFDPDTPGAAVAPQFIKDSTGVYIGSIPTGTTYKSYQPGNYPDGPFDTVVNGGPG